MQQPSIERLRRALMEKLEILHGSGVMQLPQRSGPGQAAVKQRVAQPPKVTNEASTTLIAGTGRRLTVSAQLFDSESCAGGDEAAAPSLEILQKMVASCTRCEELVRTRTQTVFGVGNPSARLWFLGEAPGADEDRLGEPFVGRAGQLLNKIIEACHMKRQDVYILNMIKCRPPGNRNPQPHELANCRGYLERQFELIRPEFICCLGAVAAQNLLGTTLSIGKLRGKVHTYRGARVVCTYHPAFLLRSPAFKKETWEDMKLLMREMGVAL